MENLFNVNQAAFILKVHPLTIRRYLKEGKLKAIRAGGNVRIKESDLREFGQEFSTQPKQTHKLLPKRADIVKTFTSADPIFRLRGRGARIRLEG